MLLYLYYRFFRRWIRNFLWKVDRTINRYYHATIDGTVALYWIIWNSISNHFIKPKAIGLICLTILSYWMFGWLFWDYFNENVVAKYFTSWCFQPVPLWMAIFFYGMPLTGILVHFRRTLFINAYRPRLFHLFLLLFFIWMYWSRHNHYIQYPLYSVKEWKYTMGIMDPVFGYLSLLGVIFFLNYFRNSTFKGGASLFVQDLPIKELSEDALFRGDYFGHLQEEFNKIAFDSEKAFSVGINSSWGYGKTSLLEILKLAFERERFNTIYIDYNPWMSNSKSGLTLDFFTQLEDELSKHLETDNLIYKYGKALAKLDLDGNPLKKISGFFEQDLSLMERHEAVSKLLRDTNKRFVVVIDDIDRLDNQEVFEVLRLIRNTANFSRVVFVAAYDKEYMFNSLGKNGIYEPKKYLEKIFDLEIMLPHIEIPLLKIIIDKIFKSGVEQFPLQQTERTEITDHFYNLIFGNFQSSNLKFKTIQDYLWKILLNKRDVVRFINALLLLFRLNHQYVYLPDLIILEMIKLYDHRYYSELALAENYLSIDLSSYIDPIYELYSPIVITGRGNAIVRNFGDKGPYDIRLEKPEMVKELIEALFVPALLNDVKFAKALRVVTNFPHYFIYAEKPNATAVSSGGNLGSALTIP